MIIERKDDVIIVRLIKSDCVTELEAVLTTAQLCHVRVEIINHSLEPLVQSFINRISPVINQGSY